MGAAAPSAAAPLSSGGNPRPPEIFPGAVARCHTQGFGTQDKHKETPKTDILGAMMIIFGGGQPSRMSRPTGVPPNTVRLGVESAEEEEAAGRMPAPPWPGHFARSLQSSVVSANRTVLGVPPVLSGIRHGNEARITARPSGRAPSDAAGTVALRAYVRDAASLGRRQASSDRRVWTASRRVEQLFV